MTVGMSTRCRRMTAGVYVPRGVRPRDIVVPGDTGRPGHRRWDHGPLPRVRSDVDDVPGLRGRWCALLGRMPVAPRLFPGTVPDTGLATAAIQTPRARSGTPRPTRVRCRSRFSRTSEALWGSLGLGGSATCALGWHPWRWAWRWSSPATCPRRRRPGSHPAAHIGGDVEPRRRRQDHVGPRLDRGPQAGRAQLPSGTGAGCSLDTSAGRTAARGRAASADRATDRLARAGGFRVTSRFAWAIQGFAARLTAGQVAALRHDPAVARVVPDASRECRCGHLATGHPTGPCVGQARRRRGPDVDMDVAVIDTGIGPVGGPGGAAAELNIVGGTDCRTSHNGDTSDGHGHGTHVAGTIGARDNGVGVVGVAPGARLWAVRVFDSSGRGTTSSVICGIDWVAQWLVDHPGRPMVANMSLRGYDEYGGPTGCDASGRDPRDPEHQAICTATAAGAVFVVAAGNEHDDTDNYIPARYDEVITVAAISDFDGLPGSSSAQSAVDGCTPPSGTEKDDTFARYSNFGTAVDIVAPGTCIRSLAPGTGATVRTAVMSGTSMATPHVTGAVALYLAAHPDADPDRVRRQVIASGTLDWAWGTDPDRLAHPGRPLLRLVDAAALSTDVPASTSGPADAVISVGRGITAGERAVRAPARGRSRRGRRPHRRRSALGRQRGRPGVGAGLTGLARLLRPRRGRRCTAW